MKSKSMMLMVLSMGFGLIAAIGISQVMGRSSSAQPAVKMGSVLVAADDVDIHQKLTEENVKIENWPANIIPEDAITSLEEITETKQIVLSRLSKGMPIVQSQCITEKEHINNGKQIPEGFKVVAIKVSGDDTISGLLKPGDKVDVIGFFKKKVNGETQTVSKTFLKALRVYSVDGSRRATRDEGSSGGGNAIVGVLVNEKQSEDIYFAQKTGSIKLVLRGDYVEGDEDVEDLAELMNWEDNVDGEESDLSSSGSLSSGSSSRGAGSGRMIIWERGSPREITFAPNQLPSESSSAAANPYSEELGGDYGGGEGYDSEINEVDSGDFSGSGSGNRNPQ